MKQVGVRSEVNVGTRRDVIPVIFGLNKWNLCHLGCQTERPHGEVGLIGRGAVAARIWAASIVKVEVAVDRDTGLADACHRLVDTPLHI